MSTPALLVLDFDGVVCQGMGEFFESSWRAWYRLRRAPLPAGRREELAARFARLRPAVEAGWEMAMLPALLAECDPAGDAELEEQGRWAEARDAFLRDHGLTSPELADALDGARDAWLETDRDGWLRAHSFYPGIADWLRRLVDAGPPTYVLSTKDKRFLDALLRWQSVPLPDDRVIGKATPRRAKWEVIQEIAARHALPPDGAGVWFVEDRLATLRELRRDAPHLPAMRLFLAEWGYVFPRDVERARDEAIPTLTLAQATGPFAGWLASNEGGAGEAGIGGGVSREIEAIAEEIELHADACLFREGEPADALFVIRSGSVRVVAYGPTGAPMIVSRLGPGDVVGEGAVLGATVRAATVIADAPAVVLRVGRAAFESVAAHDTRLRARIAALGSARRGVAPGAQAPPDGEAGIRLVGHRAYVGGLWDEIGRLQLAFLVEHGLRPSHCLLDIGCGALRGGVHFIDYLAPGHYLGLDKEPLLIERGLEQELSAETRARKRPELVVSSRFEFRRFSRRPDFSIAQSLFTHLTPDDIALCLRNLRDFVAAGHVAFASFVEGASTGNPARSNSQALFRYSRAEMERFGADAGWEATYVGDWGNPRGLRMMRYTAR